MTYPTLMPCCWEALKAPMMMTVCGEVITDATASNPS